MASLPSPPASQNVVILKGVLFVSDMLVAAITATERYCEKKELTLATSEQLGGVHGVGFLCSHADEFRQDNNGPKQRKIYAA